MIYNNITNKKPTSLRLTPDAMRLLKEIAKKLGISQTSVIEIAIRRMAESEDVK